MRMEIEKFLKELRECFPDGIAKKVFTEGSCARLSFMLKEMYPEGDVMWNEDHATFRYQGRLYDITGEVQDENYLKLEEHYNKKQIEKIRNLKYEGNF